MQARTMRLRRSKPPPAPPDGAVEVSSGLAPASDSSTSMDTSESRGGRTEPIVTSWWPGKRASLDDLGHDAGADGLAALANGEAHLLFQGHARDQLHFDRHV